MSPSLSIDLSKEDRIFRKSFAFTKKPKANKHERARHFRTVFERKPRAHFHR